MFVQPTCRTIREKMLAGFDLVWNSHTEVVHLTGQRCHAGDHLDESPRPTSTSSAATTSLEISGRQLIVDYWRSGDEPLPRADQLPRLPDLPA